MSLVSIKNQNSPISKIMKPLILLFSFLLFATGVMAQAPAAFKYQAVVRDNAGQVMANKNNVWFKVSIVRTTVTGAVVYSEIHATSTNSFGLVELEIGKGTSPVGNFYTIPWSLDAFFLKVEVDLTGTGSSYQFMGITQLLSVPYALVSNMAMSIADLAVTTAKLANNSVTIGKLPAGGTASNFLRGDGTWQVPLSAPTLPAGNDGSIQFNYRDLFSYSQYLHWDYVNNRLGVGTSSPDAKLHIYTTSSPTFPQLKLYESSTSGYARLAFQNASGSTFWALNALNSSTNANERFNLYNSFTGTVLSFSGEGHAGLGSDPYSTVKFFVKDNGNVYAGVFENDGAYTTLQARNFGTGAAGNFISNSSSYTLYAQNIGTGPAAYLDGGLQVSGGNNSEINRSQTSTANIVPICYGSVEANGTKNTGGSTANFTVTKVSTGVYDITVTGETYAQTTHCAITSLNNPGFINAYAVTGKLRVYTYNTSYVANDREFSFMIFKP
jgi:hypothetical protein